METIAVVRLTRSQQMAIVDVLLEHTRRHDSTQIFVDCSREPAVETTVGDLLRLFAVPEWEIRRDDGARS